MRRSAIDGVARVHDGVAGHLHVDPHDRASRQPRNCPSTHPTARRAAAVDPGRHHTANRITPIAHTTAPSERGLGDSSVAHGRVHAQQRCVLLVDGARSRVVVDHRHARAARPVAGLGPDRRAVRSAVPDIADVPAKGVPSPAPAPPRWELDSDFDLGFHMRRVSAPQPGTVDTVLEMARCAAMETSIAHGRCGRPHCFDEVLALAN